MVITVSILQENFLTKCRPWTTKKCQIFTLIYHWNFKGRCIWRFRRGAKILRGGAKLFQGRCSPHNPAMESAFTMHRIMPMWKYGKQRTFVILIHETKGMECCAQIMSSSSWGGSSTQRAAIKETCDAPQNILKIKCPRLAKKAFATQHLWHTVTL
jgi:hypothetical protein